MNLAALAALARRYTKVLRDASWIGLGTVLAAAGTVLGLRLVTEVAAPDVFGALVVANGILALCTGVALQPVAQAALRFYPDLERTGDAETLRDVMGGESLRRIAGLVPLVALLALFVQHYVHGLSVAAWCALLATLLVEPLRTIELVLRNASGDQAGYALLVAIDATARPLGAAGCAWLYGSSLEALLLGQLLAAACVLAFFTTRLPRPKIAAGPSWRPEFRAYGAPLTWIALLSWMLSLVDRYVVAWLLGTTSAGIYAAVYGVVSRPMLILGGIVEATLRQRLYAAVARGDTRHKARVERSWLALNIGIGLAIGAALVALAEWIVAIVLAEAYRGPTLPLILPLALGHVPVLAYQAVIRRLYAAGRTRQVLLADGAGAGCAAGGAVLGTLLGGLSGTAWAMPIYAGLQLALAVTLSRRLARCGNE